MTATDELASSVVTSDLLSMLAQLSQSSTATSDVQILLMDFVSYIRRALAVDCCDMLQLVEGQWRHRAGIGWSLSAAQKALLASALVPQAAFTLRARGPVIAEDFSRRQSFARAPLLLAAGVASSISVAIPADGGGVLVAHTYCTRCFSQEEVLFLQAAAGLLASALVRLADRARLVESRAHWALARGIAAMGTWVLDAQSGAFDACSGLYAIFGLSPADAVDLETLSSQVHVGDRGLLEETIRVLAGGQRLAHVELRIIRADGELRHIRSAYEAVPDSAGGLSRIFGVVLDISDLRQAEGVIDESRSLLQLASASALLGGWQFDLAPKTVSWYISGGLLPSGALSGRLALRGVMRLFSPEYRRYIRHSLESCVRFGESIDIELPLKGVYLSAVRVWVVGHAEYDRFGALKSIRGSFQDISERKRNEAEIERLGDRLRTTLESTTDVYFTLDRGWRFTYLNHRAEALFERPRASLLGRVFWAEFPDAVQAGFQAHYQRAMQSAKPTTFTEFYPPLRRWFEVLAYPVAEGLALHVRDISRQVALDQKVLQQAALLDGAPDAILVCDLNGRLSYWNRAAESLLGWRRDEVLGKVMAAVMGEGNEVALQVCVRQFARFGEWSGSLRLRRRDGVDVVVRSQWTLVDAPAGERVSIQILCRDISEQARLEERLTKVQKLQSIGQLAAGIVHDFNNLLTIINGNSLLLLDHLGDDPSLAAIVSEVQFAGRQGAQLTRHLLSLASHEALEPQLLRPATVIRHICPLLQRSLGSAIRFEVLCDEQVWPVIADGVQLEAALLNLCINGRDAMPDGGDLQLAVRNFLDDEAQLSGAAGAYVHFAIQDTGRGISPEIMSRVFEPFFTTKAHGKGSGLGLSMVQGFVQRANGFLNIDSAIDRGTRVNLYLPRAKIGSADGPVIAD